MRKPRVFISYTHANSGFVDSLVAGLQASGVDVWIDKWQIKVGDSIVKKINEAIHESDFLIVVLSKDSVRSKWVQEELSAATVRNIEETRQAFILPILMEDCEIPELLKHRKYANFKDQPETAFRVLLNTIVNAPPPAGPLTSIPVSLPDLIETVRQVDRSVQGTGSKDVGISSFWSGLLDQHRVIYLGGGIDDSKANEVVAKLLLLNGQDKKRDIHLYVDAEMGSATAAFAIYDSMQYVEAPVATYALSNTGGMGTLLVAGGAPGQRYALEGITLRIHIPTRVFRRSGRDEATLQSYQEDLHDREVSRMTRMVVDIMQSHTELPHSFFESYGEKGKYVSAEDALKFKIVDFLVPSATHLWGKSLP